MKKIIHLTIGLFFLFYSNGENSFSLAAWLFPLFLLLVTRKLKNKAAFIVLTILMGIVTQLAFWKIVPSAPTDFIFYIPFFWGLILGLLFYFDSIIYNKLNGFTATLFFPLAYTSLDFISNLFNPYGTLGALAYSQYDFLLFAQLASITGLWGLTFMITCFGSILHWYLENQNNNYSKKGVYLYFYVLIIIFAFGGIRLIISDCSEKVRIAGIHTHDKEIEGIEMHKALEDKDTIAFRKISNIIINKLIEKTKKEANADAKIIIWSEISPKIIYTEEDSLNTVFKSLAKELNIYLITCPYIVFPKGSISENKVQIFSPTGELLLTQYKYGGAFIEGTKEGDKRIHTLKTPYGRISSIICWDGDFPTNLLQVGKQHSDILFVPASDWNEIDPAHAICTVFRGIENGCSVVRQTRNGLSIMTDQRGRTITQLDHFSTTNWTIVGQVPSKRWFTIYTIIGDIFGWLAIAGTILIVILSVNTQKLN